MHICTVDSEENSLDFMYRKQVLGPVLLEISLLPSHCPLECPALRCSCECPRFSSQGARSLCSVPGSTGILGLWAGRGRQGGEGGSVGISIIFCASALQTACKLKRRSR